MLKWRPLDWVRLCLLKVLRPFRGFFLLTPCEAMQLFVVKKAFIGQLFEKTILYSGSLGSGVDEERSKLRVGM